MAKVKNRNMDRTGWMENDNLGGTETFFANQAIYVFAWNTETDSWNWESKLSRSGNTKITNNDTLEMLIEDNCAAFIETSNIDKTGISFCNAELFLATYNSSNTELKKWKLDRDYVGKVAAGGTIGDLWDNKNLSLQGTKKYTLANGDYAKLWIEINYDGPSPSVIIDTAWHEHTHLKY